MRFDGEWLTCDDGIVRPIMRCEVLGGDGQWRSAEFLVDSGADRTVLSANVLGAMALDEWTPGEEIRGVGGVAATVAVTTQIRLTRENLEKVVFRGEFVACRDRELLDMSVLGRDITQLVAVIVDRPGQRVCMLRDGHSYLIR
jgi:hypothetical protein